MCVGISTSIHSFIEFGDTWLKKKLKNYNIHGLMPLQFSLKETWKRQSAMAVHCGWLKGIAAVKYFTGILLKSCCLTIRSFIDIAQ